MKLKTAKIIFCIGGILMILLFVLYFLTPIRAFLIAAIVMAFADLIFWILFGRCPACGKYLGRQSGEYCSHCGERIE